MSVIDDIAAAVVADMTGAPSCTFGQAFTPVQAYLPQYDLGDMKNLHVTVVPKGVTIQPFGRGACQYDYAIDVAVQQKLAATDPATIAPLMGLVDQIGEFFRLRRLTNYPAAIWAKTEHPHLYAQEHLEQLRQFTSVLTLTFRVVQ
jgi:hypothetical protein